MDQINKLTDTVFGASARPFFDQTLQGLGVSSTASGTIASLIIPGLLVAALLVVISMRGRRT
jgi:hypothetical protein